MKSVQQWIDETGCDRRTAEHAANADKAEQELRRIDAELADTVAGFRSAATDLAKRWDLEPAGKSKGLDLDAGEARTRLAELKTRYADTRRSLEHHTRALAAYDGGGGVEGELRRQAAWHRAQRALDSAEPGHTHKVAAQLVQDAISADDRAAMNALRRELPAYMAATGHPPLPAAVTGHLDLLANDVAAFGSSTQAVADAGTARLDAAFREAGKSLKATVGRDGTIDLPGTVLPRYNGTTTAYGVEVSTSQTDPTPTDG